MSGWDRETQEGEGPDLVGALLLPGVIPLEPDLTDQGDLGANTHKPGTQQEWRHGGRG